jgi:hypothetical protein
VSASGNVLTVSLSLPEDQFQQLVKIGSKAGGAAMQGNSRRAIRETSPRK